MKKFIEQLKDIISEDENKSYTENGALGYRTTTNPLLDINFKVSSYRQADEETIINDFLKSFYYDKSLTLKWLFFARDIRCGLGERRLFRIVSEKLANSYPDKFEYFIPLIAEYGRFDDLVYLLNDKVNVNIQQKILSFLKKKLEQDLDNFKKKQNISLLAKWLPSCNTSSDDAKVKAKKIIDYLKLTQKQYRKMLSKLRNYLDVIETKITSNKWDKIDYSKVPSKANLIYKNAFIKHDEKRRNEFLEKLVAGETKINSSVLFPHDIANKYVDSKYYSCDVKQEDVTLEELWKNLPNYIEDENNKSSTIVVADSSGSMLSSIGNGNVMAITVCYALAIYFAQSLKGAFNNKIITFSEHPQFIEFPKNSSLHDKLEVLFSYSECANTNIESVFDLILKTAVKNNLKQEDIPNNILILSDMEFDYCATDKHNKIVDKKLFQVIEEKYKEKGYKMPRLNFWNLNSRTGTIPLKENEKGVTLISGFSAVVAKMVLSNNLDPFNCLVDMLNSDRYAPIDKVIMDNIV